MYMVSVMPGVTVGCFNWCMDRLYTQSLCYAWCHTWVSHGVINIHRVYIMSVVTLWCYEWYRGRFDTHGLLCLLLLFSVITDVRGRTYPKGLLCLLLHLNFITDTRGDTYTHGLLCLLSHFDFVYDTWVGQTEIWGLSCLDYFVSRRKKMAVGYCKGMCSSNMDTGLVDFLHQKPITTPLHFYAAVLHSFCASLCRRLSVENNDFNQEATISRLLSVVKIWTHSK